MTRLEKLYDNLYGWEILVLGPAFTVIYWPPALPAWGHMWLLSLVTFFGCKWLTWRRADLKSGISPVEHLEYLFAWPGMEPEGFFNPPVAVEKVSLREWLLALFKLIAGLFALFVLCPLLSETAMDRYLFAWCGMCAIAFILHFGLFHLFSCFWRVRGKVAPRLMNAPILSTSVSDFWGKRWNMAFRDITHRHLFRPLSRRWGHHWALVIGFFFSGLIHDLVISVPAGGGYGLPTLFFMVQAFGILASRSTLGKQVGIHRGIRGWLFAVLVVLGPCPLVFHRRFAEEVILPFLKTIGAA